MQTHYNMETQTNTIAIVVIVLLILMMAMGNGKAMFIVGLLGFCWALLTHRDNASQITVLFAAIASAIAVLLALALPYLNGSS